MLFVRDNKSGMGSLGKEGSSVMMEGRKAEGVRLWMARLGEASLGAVLVSQLFLTQQSRPTCFSLLGGS